MFQLCLLRWQVFWGPVSRASPVFDEQRHLTCTQWLSKFSWYLPTKHTTVHGTIIFLVSVYLNYWPPKSPALFCFVLLLPSRALVPVQFLLQQTKAVFPKGSARENIQCPGAQRGSTTCSAPAKKLQLSSITAHSKASCQHLTAGSLHCWGSPAPQVSPGSSVGT